MTKRALIIGSSTTGKTTLLKYLKDTTKLPLSEADNVLIQMNEWSSTGSSQKPTRINQSLV